MIEYSIKVKDNTNTFTAKDFSNDPLLLSKDNPFLIERVKEAFGKFPQGEGSEAPEIVIKFKMIWQS